MTDFSPDRQEPPIRFRASAGQIGQSAGMQATRPRGSQTAQEQFNRQGYIGEAAQISQSLYNNYVIPLQAQQQWVPGTTQLPPENIQLMASYYGGLQQHPLEQGGQVDPNSRIAN